MPAFTAVDASGWLAAAGGSGKASIAICFIAAVLAACSAPGPQKPPECAGATCDAGCLRDAGRCGSVMNDLPPVSKIRFNTQSPARPDDYPYAPDSLPSQAPAPHSTVYLSAGGSFDPEGQAISFFWNVQDQSGKYLTLNPDPMAASSSFSPEFVGTYKITLAVVELGGLEQLTQAALTLNVVAPPCAADGFSAPCSDELAVPGGTFMVGSADDVGFANEHPSHLANVAPFLLDKYEVTVGRFRRFVTTFKGDGFPDGAGAHPLIPGSGWQSAWNGQMSQGLMMSISECGGPWTDLPGDSEARPVSCVTWYQAFAFCIWDGKRLPTGTEWEYAAAGGSEQRKYPWGSNPPSPNLAVYGCLFDGQSDCSDADLPAVGNASAGAGRWGHQDLAGSVWEWTLDVYAPYTAALCDNCADVDVTAEDGRVFRGGDFLYDDQGEQGDLRAASRLGFDAKFPDPTRGLRCARTP